MATRNRDDDGTQVTAIPWTEDLALRSADAKGLPRAAAIRAIKARMKVGMSGGAVKVLRDAGWPV